MAKNPEGEGEKIRLARREQRVLTLGGRGGGYTWDFQIAGDTHVIEVTRRTASAADGESEAGPLENENRGRAHSPSLAPPRNYTLDEVFIVRALDKAGSARVLFELSRPWERGKKEPLDRRTFDIVVV